MRSNFLKCVRGLLVVCAWLSHFSTAATAAPPPNDLCANAKTISAGSYVDAEDTTSATTDPQDPIPICGEQHREKSVWYVITPPSAATVSADTLDSDYDTIISVYTGTCANLQPVPNGCNDDDPLDGAQSSVSLDLAPGITYYFMISSFNDDGGNLVLRVHLSAVSATPTPTATPKPSATFTPSGTPGPSGDANCDGRTTVADLTAVALLISTGDRAPCGLDDVNGDGIVNAVDLSEVVEALFAP